MKQPTIDDELERRLAILPYLRATTAAAARLWTRLDPALVLKTLTDVLVADFGAALARTWVYDPEANVLRLMTSRGLSRRVKGSSRAVIDVANYPYKVGRVARTHEPFVRTGLADDPEFDRAWVLRESLEGVVCLPILVGDQLLGVMVAFFRRPVYDELVETIGHLAALAGAALNDAHLVAQERQARALADRASDHFRLLARVSERLSGSLNPEVTAQNVADALVPEFADWCIVDLLDESGALDTVASAHRSARKRRRFEQLRTRYPPLQPTHAIRRAIAEEATVWETVSDDDLAARAVDEHHLALLREVGIGSRVVVPLRARGRVIGAISLVRGPRRTPFVAEDVATGEDIGRRTALATDNALLYRSAQEAIAQRDRFLAVASHELRTPLATVLGHWELLNRRVTRTGHDLDAHREQIETSLRRLGNGIDQLRRLVDDLLDVNRLRGGTMGLQLTDVDLTTLLRDTVAGMRQADDRHRIRLRLPRKPVVGRWDSARLAQVIDNMLTNALKYSHDGPVEVRLARGRESALIEVRDSGIGIPPDQLEAIFEPFSRAPNASEHRVPGFGLGLSVSREIVSQMGGRMWASSDGEDSGSTFHVELGGALAP